MCVLILTHNSETFMLLVCLSLVMICSCENANCDCTRNCFCDPCYCRCSVCRHLRNGLNRGFIAEFFPRTDKSPAKRHDVKNQSEVKIFESEVPEEDSLMFEMEDVDPSMESKTSFQSSNPTYAVIADKNASRSKLVNPGYMPSTSAELLEFVRPKTATAPESSLQTSAFATRTSSNEKRCKNSKTSCSMSSTALSGKSGLTTTCSLSTVTSPKPILKSSLRGPNRRTEEKTSLSFDPSITEQFKKLLLDSFNRSDKLSCNSFTQSVESDSSMEAIEDVGNSYQISRHTTGDPSTVPRNIQSSSYVDVSVHPKMSRAKSPSLTTCRVSQFSDARTDLASPHEI